MAALAAPGGGGGLRGGGGGGGGGEMEGEDLNPRSKAWVDVGLSLRQPRVGNLSSKKVLLPNPSEEAQASLEREMSRTRNKVGQVHGGAMTRRKAMGSPEMASLSNGGGGVALGWRRRLRW
ncbi:hypothetical protein NL676_011979 [Syzygium grande]|nr:hypothetical protein NL676_011979 [Syzygium grande]